MSHKEQQQFLLHCITAFSRSQRLGKVLEVGSYDVNGSLRDSLDVELYVGVDLVEGPGVDVVGYGHEVRLGLGEYDVAFAGEVFEHDPHFLQTLENLLSHVRPGGLVLFTCATKGRPEHGTRRTDLNDSPGTQSVGLDYYKNVTVEDFKEFSGLADFKLFRFYKNRINADLYFWGVKAGGVPTESRPLISRLDVLKISLTSKSLRDTLYCMMVEILCRFSSDSTEQRIRSQGFFS